MKHLKVKFAVRISIAKIREGELEKILQSIIIEFFRRQDSVLYETTWFDLFVISRPQLRRHCFARVPSSLAYRYPPPSLLGARFCSFSGIWLASRWYKNLTSRISSCRAEGFARPLRSTSSSTCGTRLYERWSFENTTTYVYTGG